MGRAPVLLDAIGGSGARFGESSRLQRILFPIPAERWDMRDTFVVGDPAGTNADSEANHDGTGENRD